MEHRQNAIVAFGFGEPWNANPNARIADKAFALICDTGAGVIFTDRDISPHLAEAGVVVEEIDLDRVPSTYRLALRAVKGAKERKLDVLYVVAARCHMWRCLRDLRWAARDCDMEIVLFPRAIVGYQYDPAASTFFTRSVWQWWSFEIAYRILSALAPSWYKRTRA